MKRTVAILLVAVLLVGFSSCLKKTDVDSVTTDDMTSSTVTKNTSGETGDPSSIEFFKTDEAMYEINSKHCSLQYPEKWKDNVAIEVNETGDAYSVIFYAIIAEEKIPMYAFVFGISDEGYCLGSVNTEKGNQDVFIIDMFGEYKGGLSEEAEYLYYEMCEGVNHVISKLVYDNGMVIS